MDYGMRLGLRQGAETSLRPQGPGVMLDALDPAVRALVRAAGALQRVPLAPVGVHQLRPRPL